MPTETPKILVIEDEDLVRQSYEDMLSFFGYEVESVPNGREGMSRITKNDYDIVITEGEGVIIDLNAYDLDGDEPICDALYEHIHAGLT